MRGLSLVAASGGHSSSRYVGLSLSQPLLLQSTSSRRAGSVVVAHRPSCSTACGIFPDQGSNPCPLHWQADSQPLRHQGSPTALIFYRNWTLKFCLPGGFSCYENPEVTGLDDAHLSTASLTGWLWAVWGHLGTALVPINGAAFLLPGCSYSPGTRGISPPTGLRSIHKHFLACLFAMYLVEFGGTKVM